MPERVPSQRGPGCHLCAHRCVGDAESLHPKTVSLGEKRRRQRAQSWAGGKLRVPKRWEEGWSPATEGPLLPGAPTSHKGNRCRVRGTGPPYQVPELGRQASVGGLLHVHHLRVCAQDVELPEPARRRERGRAWNCDTEKGGRLEDQCKRLRTLSPCSSRSHLCKTTQKKSM